MNSKGKVVVIDDSPIVRKMAEVALEEEGYEVYSAEDGEEGIKITQEIVPSVILVDFIMPKMSGYQFCQAIKENQLLKDIPVILITGKGEDVGKKFLEKFDVVDYFIKPFKSADLVDKVNSIIQMQKTMFQENEIASSDALQQEPFAIELPESPEIETLQEIELAEEMTQQEPFAIEFPESPEIETLQEIELAEEMTQQKPFAIELPESPEIEKLQTAQTPVSAEAEKIQMETPYVSSIENEVERIMKKFLQEEFQFTIQKSIANTLKQAGVIRSSDIILSGNLSVFPIRNILHLIAGRVLTVKFSIFSDILSSDVYFDKGKIICASMNSQSTAPVSEKNQFSGMAISKDSTDDIIHSAKESIYDAICAVLELESGNFSIEIISLSDNLKDIPVRLSVSNSLIEASRKVNDKVFANMFGDRTIFFKEVTDYALRDYNLNKSELRIFACINGERSVSDIIDISGLDKMQALRVFYVLLNGGIAKRIKGEE